MPDHPATTVTLHLGDVVLDANGRRGQVVYVHGNRQSHTHAFPPIGSVYGVLTSPGCYHCFDDPSEHTVLPEARWTVEERVRLTIMLNWSPYDWCDTDDEKIDHVDEALARSFAGIGRWDAYWDGDRGGWDERWPTVAKYVDRLEAEHAAVAEVLVWMRDFAADLPEHRAFVVRGFIEKLTPAATDVDIYWGES